MKRKNGILIYSQLGLWLVLSFHYSFNGPWDITDLVKLIPTCMSSFVVLAIYIVVNHD